jgi:hypothetical protein
MKTVADNSVEFTVVTEEGQKTLIKLPHLQEHANSYATLDSSPIMFSTHMEVNTSAAPATDAPRQQRLPTSDL